MERTDQHPQSLINQTVLEIWGLETGNTPIFRIINQIGPETGNTSLFRIFVDKDEHTVNITDKSQEMISTGGFFQWPLWGPECWTQIVRIYFHICLSSSSWGLAACKSWGEMLQSRDNQEDAHPRNSVNSDMSNYNLLLGQKTFSFSVQNTIKPIVLLPDFKSAVRKDRQKKPQSCVRSWIFCKSCGSRDNRVKGPFQQQPWLSLAFNFSCLGVKVWNFPIMGAFYGK